MSLLIIPQIPSITEYPQTMTTKKYADIIQNYTTTAPGYIVHLPDNPNPNTEPYLYGINDTIYRVSRSNPKTIYRYGILTKKLNIVPFPS